ncbi:MarR family transcriptional regulator [Desulfallas sp. Bu1-1]|uniref:MarR family transcriptional regulator n=1 Tax=Desulfallas sp. Bu1-1 TaxID=2787620 RepID=UPI00189E3832|nr:MarR family transcriptional regulator [Desulfallas sp. Bu1-1]MBF7083838.1 MarR family transcriptional regulator [Desulfallas sp. Bu1-1]
MKEEVRDIREIIREEMLMRDKILAVLRDGPKTVPEIAQALGCPSHEVMYWVMGMRKYGHVAETEEEDGYYKYRAVAGEGK